MIRREALKLIRRRCRCTMTQAIAILDAAAEQAKRQAAARNNMAGDVYNKNKIRTIAGQHVLRQRTAGMQGAWTPETRTWIHSRQQS